jgi:hypothetical protein
VLGDQNITPVLPIGFPFNFYGSTYSSIRIDSNGWLSFTATASAGAPSALPAAAAPNALIAGLWFDANPSLNPTGDVRYTTVGTSPNRKFIVNYIGIPYYSTALAPYTDNVTFQIALNEVDNSVEVFCADCTLNYAAPRVHGLENAAGTAYRSGTSVAALLATSTTFSIPNNTGWRYPAGSLVALVCKAPTATDLIANGTETDVDCGGNSGAVCAVGRNCLNGEDCTSATCTDGICGKLADGATCGVSYDCQSDYCLAGTATDSQPGVYAGTYGAIDASKPECTTALGPANCFTLGDSTKSANQTLPFAFKFFGVDYTTFFISPSGYISFDTAESNSETAQNIALPTIPTAGAHPAVSPGPAIFLYQFDTLAGPDAIRWWTEGTAPNRRAIIAYSDVPYYSGAAVGGAFTGQIILNETSNTVELQLESYSTGTTLYAHTRGVRNGDGTQAFFYQGATHLDSENARAFPSTLSTALTNSRRLYRTNPAPSTCAAAGSRGATCLSNADCLSGACAANGVATALANPGLTPPADFQTSATSTASSTVSGISTTVLYPAATGVTLGIPLGFPYKFFGRTYTGVRGAVSGYLSFLSTTTSSATFANLESATTTTENGLVAYWWRGMAAFSATNNATFSTTGTAPFRVFTYDVNGLTTATAQPVKARVQLYESTSLIDVTCYNCSLNGGTVTKSAQGIESIDGTTATGNPARVLTTAAGGATAAQNNTAYRFNTGSSAVCF